jgi:hypothetical protein
MGGGAPLCEARKRLVCYISAVPIRIIDSRSVDFPRLPAALLHDPITGETVALRMEDDDSGFSAWWRFKISIDHPQMEPAAREKRLRSRLYLFKAWPAARVEPAVPPP